jgi:class 3 adenylate cyclase/tetratricopeptide (TPR) repeat protein
MTHRTGARESAAPHGRPRIVGYHLPLRHAGEPSFMMSSNPAPVPLLDEDTTEPRISIVPDPESAADRLSLYLPRILQHRLLAGATDLWWTAEGTAVFIDISGFTKLSERLARKGREGSEQITEAIGGSFESLLLVAYENGAGLIKFGGDALLLWFHDTGHAARACRASVMMRRVLRDVGRIEVPGAKVTLRMTQGVHSGHFHFFAVGTSHVELLPVGPAWSRVVVMEHEAEAGEIMVSPETAQWLPSRCLGERKGPGYLLLREPLGNAAKIPLTPRPAVPEEMLARCLSPAIRAHVRSGGGTPEHRPVTVAFIHFDGTDGLIEMNGEEATARALQQLVDVVDAATAEQDVSFLASDVDYDGGKLILTAGAPKVTGDDEERMLLALRRIAAAELPLPIRIGVHRGAVFAGDIGPFYRRTYTVMGDAVNLSARLMAKAEPGTIYATADVLDRSNTLFETIELEPFAVKGKTQPVRAWSVGRAVGSRTRQVAMQQLPLIGRDRELQLLRQALDDARAGTGRVVEIVGEAGLGKSRLLQALIDQASGFSVLHAVCEAYTASTPYAIWRELLRECMGFGRDDPDEAVAERLRALVADKAPQLLPWLPLIAIALGLEFAATPEVEMLTESNRRAKLHQAIGALLAAIFPDPLLIVIENAHHIDRASAALLSYLAGVVGEHAWFIGLARRPSPPPVSGPGSAAVIRIDLGPLSASDAARMTQLAAAQHPLPLHVLQVVAERSGGNPQFLRDLLRAAITSGGVGGLPESAEAATMARIDALAPADRALVRRVAVLGLTFHPRMLSWLHEDGDAAPVDGPDAFERLRDLFEEESDGYLRFGRSLLRDAAYEGLPYKVRRRLHGAVAARIRQESDNADDVAGILSLHYFEAGDYGSACRYAGVAARRAQDIYADVEAANLFTRALDAGRRLPEITGEELAVMHAAQADSWYRSASFQKAAEGYAASYRLVKDDPVAAAKLLLKRSWVEEKLGRYPQARRWATRARNTVSGLSDPEAVSQAARSTSFCAVVLQVEGRTNDALRWAKRAVDTATPVADHEALGASYHVMGWAFGELGRPGAREYLERALEAYRRSGNLARQATILSDLGVVCQWEGRWDEALAYYERGRDEMLKIGNTVPSAIARVNIAEILIDRGELAEAEELLQATMPLWKAAQYRFFLGATYSLLGRLSLRAGRLDEALQRLEESRAHFVHLKAGEEVPPVEARIAECRVAMGDAAGALELVDNLLGRMSTSNGVARVEALLRRVRAHALLRRGQTEQAKEALAASLAAARARRDLFETTLTLHSQIELARREGIEPPREDLLEIITLLGQLKIRVASIPSLKVEPTTA